MASRWHFLPASLRCRTRTSSKEAGARQDAPERQLCARRRYRSSYFSHIWDTGYSAAVFTPISGRRCSPIDGYQWFEEHGELTRANGDRFRKMVLSRRQYGGSGEDVCGLARGALEYEGDAEA